MTLLEEISGLADPDAALDAILRHFRADSGTIHLLRGDGLLHLISARGGFPESVLNAIRTIPPGKGMAGLAFERRKPVDSCNIQADTTGDVRPGARATGMGGAIVVPMFRGDEVIGALGIASQGERTFDEADASLLMAASRLVPVL
jgi:GAF domain-containing protein